LRGALGAAGEMCVLGQPLQRPEAAQYVAIVGMNPQRPLQVRGRSLEVATLQLEASEHRQRERDCRWVAQRATDGVVLAQQPLGQVEVVLIHRQHALPEQPERQQHAAWGMRPSQTRGLDEQPAPLP